MKRSCAEVVSEKLYSNREERDQNLPKNNNWLGYVASYFRFYPKIKSAFKITSSFIETINSYGVFPVILRDQIPGAGFFTGCISTHKLFINTRIGL